MAKSEALGRGLGALLGEMEEVYDNEIPKHESVIEIPVSQIRPNPFQPRKSFDERSLAELSDSIKEHGLLQPVVVVEDIDGYILVAGERRLRASKMARVKSIRAVIASVNEEQMRQHALVENIQRDQLNAIELAHAYNELLKVHAITHDELSSMIHKSRAQITNTLRLLQLGKKAQKMLVEGKISAGHAKVLVGLDEKEQNMMVDSIIGQKLSVRDVENMVKQIKGGATKPQKPATAPQLDFSRLKEQLSAMGYKTSSSGKKITIEFSDEHALSEFMQHFLH